MIRNTQKIFLAIPITLNFALGTTAFAKEDGWILTQRSKILGDQYLYINNRGVKCINPKQGIGWITRAPNWNVTFFNEKTRIYYSLSAASLKAKIAKSGFMPRNIRWSKVSSGSMAGLKASEYKMINNPSSTKSARWQSATYWLADDINVPASLAQIISSTYGLPASDSIPLALNYLTTKGSAETVLSTYHQQNTAVPDSYFTIPTGFKSAKSEEEVLVTKENKAFIDELVNDISTSHSPNKINPQLIDASKQITPDTINKLPNQVNLPGGRTVSKDQINNFLNKLKQGQQQ